MKVGIPIVGLVATSALAQGVEQPIVDAITVIQARTQQVDTDVLAWNGDRRGFRPIFFDSQKLLKSINNGTDVANANEPLDFNGAVNVGLATLNLIPVVNQTLIDFIAAIPKFNKLYLTPTVLDSLNQQEAASDAFSAAVIAKVPDDLKDLAGQVTAPIDEDFDVAIAAFQAAVDSLPKVATPPQGLNWLGLALGEGLGLVLNCLDRSYLHVTKICGIVEQCWHDVHEVMNIDYVCMEKSVNCTTSCSSRSQMHSSKPATQASELL